jgi:quercetin dioxygenase-like cupin family protein
VTGDGYAVGSLDGMGDGPGFRKIRRELDVKELGANGLVLPPGIEAGWHYHEEQEEVYFVHSGTLEIEFGDGSKHELGPGGVARVDAPTARILRNTGDEDLVLVIFGGKGGYVGRDGQVPEGKRGGPGPIGASA